jgi:uncharacterized protein YggE
MPQLEVQVDGTGSVFRVAERAYVRLSITATSTDQSAALENAQSTVAVLTSHIRTLATKTEDGLPHPSAAVTAFTVRPLSTTSYYQRDKSYNELRRLPKEYQVSSSAEIIFRDFTQLAETSVELANMPYLSINGTEWRLTEATLEEIRREARLKAIRDAVQKANDYAGVVGRRVVAVEIKDGSSEADEYPGYMSNRMKQTAQMGLMQQQQQLAQAAAQQRAAGVTAVTSDGPALEPKTITVSASVNARFVSNDAGGDREMENVG